MVLTYIEEGKRYIPPTIPTLLNLDHYYSNLVTIDFILVWQWKQSNHHQWKQ